MLTTKWQIHGGSMVAAVALVGCVSSGRIARADDRTTAPALPPVEFIISYLPRAVNTVNGIVVVRPPPGRLLIGTASGARVELSLPYEAPQILDSFTFQPKEPPDERYAFNVPPTFTPGKFACVPGQPLTQVTVTDVSGATLSRRFALCPGVPMNADLAYGSSALPPLPERRCGSLGMKC